jgi:hypothetical protein
MPYVTVLKIVMGLIAAFVVLVILVQLLTQQGG